MNLDPSNLLVSWDHRHRSEGPLRSGGHIGRTEPENQAFYALRLGLLIGLLGGMGGESGRNTVVDAGSGKGYFSERLAACGYRVTAIDSSPFAIAAAESVTTGGVRYLCGDLSIAASLGSFDAVVCVDVLFHIMDDTHWAVALDGLASVVRPGGVLVYSDAAVSEPSNLGGYIRHRPTRAYAERLSQLGFRQTGFEAFGVGRSDIGFYRFERR